MVKKGDRKLKLPKWSPLRGEIHYPPALSRAIRIQGAQENTTRARKAKGIKPSMPKFSWDNDGSQV